MIPHPTPDNAPTPPAVELNRTGPMPLHAQIADQFRRQIHSGFWPQNSRIRAEDQFAEDLGVARGTVRRAIHALVEEGLLVQVQGSGTFVTGHGPDASAARAARALEGPLFSNGQQLARSDIYFTDRLQEYALLPAGTPSTVFAGDAIFRDVDVLAFQRVRSLREGPDSVIATEVSLSAIPGLRGIAPADLTAGSFHALLSRRFSVNFTYAERVYSAEAADERLAHLLQIAPGTPLLVHDQYSYDAADRCIEHSRAWTRTDHHTQTIVVKAIT